MTSDQNVSEVQPRQELSASADQQDGNVQFSAQTASHGMGQSKSSPPSPPQAQNKALDGQQTGQPQQAADPSSGQSVQIKASAQPQQQNQQGQQQGQQNAGGKRWKKKFRDRDRQRGDTSGSGGFRGPDTHQPGNTVSGFKRKGGGGKQQRGPRGFVGPMDHSYRAVNGNFADGPPSTIDSGNYQPRSNGSGRTYVSDSQPIDYSQGKAIPIPEDAPTKIFFFIEDLFFTAKIQETARKLGVKVAFIKNEKDAIADLLSLEEDVRPGLIVFDLNNANAKPLTLIPKLKAKLKRGTSIIGFLQHIQGDLKAKAVEAGCDTVMPRAAFSQNLPNLLRRYGFEEEDETNYNQ